MANTQQSLRVLCLDGGGTKGYTTLLILKRIFRELQDIQGLDEEPKPYQVFDLIVGTSTGGLIAIMLGRLHMSIDDCIKQYEDLSKDIFGRKPYGGTVGRLIKGMANSPWYDIETLQAKVQKVVEQQSFDKNEAFREKEKPACKVMVCVTRTAINKVDFLRTYKTSHVTQNNYDCTIWEAASATAAAPIYFNPVTFSKGSEKWCDGGLHENNPTNEALAEIAREAEFKDKPIGCLVSLGTGVPKLIGVSENLADFLIKAVEMMKNCEDVANKFAQSPEGQKLLNTQRYFRFSVPQGTQDLNLDEVDKTEHMKAITDHYLNQVVNGKEILNCARILTWPDENMKQSMGSNRSIIPHESCVHFIDRPLYSKALEKFFAQSNGTQQRYIVWGPGGFGKTQIALQFAHSSTQQLSVYWIRADSLSNFLSDYSQIFEFRDKSSSKIAKDTSLSEAANKVKIQLEKDPVSWLIVLDNADHWEDFLGNTGESQSINAYVPRRGRILVTTRDSQFLGRFAAANCGMQVLPMTKREASNLLMKSVHGHLRAQKEALPILLLVKELGNLPLAIAQAAANINDQQISVQEYIEAYRDKKHRMSLMEVPAYDNNTSDPRAREQSIQVTWELSFERLELQHPQSARCLSHMGFYRYYQIPSLLIRDLPEFKDLDNHAFRTITKPLLRLAMIERKTEGGFEMFSVHPVVHECLLFRLSHEHKLHKLNENVNVMVSYFPSCRLAEDSLAQFAMQSLHLHALAQSAIGEDLEFKSESFARLLYNLATYLRSTGFIPQALGLARSSLTVAKEVCGPTNKLTFEAMCLEMVLLCENAEYEDACPKIEAAMSVLSMVEAIDEQYRPSFRASILCLKASVFMLLNKREESQQLMREVLDSDSIRGSSPITIASIKLQAAEALADQGKFDEAEKMMHELPDYGGADNYRKAPSVVMYGMLFLIETQIIKKISSSRNPGREGRRSATEAWILIRLRQLHEMYFNFVGIDNEDRWRALNCLASELDNQGKYEEAAEIVGSELHLLIGSGIQTRGQFRGILITALRNIIARSRMHNSSRARDMEDLAHTALRWIGLSSLEIVVVNNNASIYMDGYTTWSEIEKYSREALGVDESCCHGRCIEFHYINMLAVASQGRIDEAQLFRQENFIYIGPAEAMYGDLEAHLALEKSCRGGELGVERQLGSENAGRLRTIMFRWF